MKWLILISGILFFINTSFSYQKDFSEEPELFPIVEYDRWGFIDVNGNKVIKPKYKMVGEFSEGLAPARLEGTYGYIDYNGSYVLDAIYDYAEPFENGIAKVYIDAKPFIINKSGQILFEHDFKEIEGFGKNFSSKITTHSGNQGMINVNGEFIIDTLYGYIYEISKELKSVGVLVNEDDFNYRRWLRGIIDSSGNVVIGINKYASIREFKNGFFSVKDSISSGTTKILDKHGILKFELDDKKMILLSELSDELFEVNIFFYDMDTVKTWYSNQRYDYKGVISSEGEVIFSNQAFEYITPFSNGKALVKDTSRIWYLIDIQGNRIGDKIFNDVILYNDYQDEEDYNNVRPFDNGLAVVKTEDGTGIINSDGEYLIYPIKFDFDVRSLVKRGQLLFYKSLQGWGFWNIEKGVMVNPRFYEISIKDFSGSLSFAKERNKTGYVNDVGEYVWEFGRSMTYYSEFETDHKIELNTKANSPYGRYVAGYDVQVDHYSNLPLIITGSKKFKENKFELLVRPDEETYFRNFYRGIKMYLYNSTNDSIHLKTIDGKINILLQAKGKNDEWIDLEYSYPATCIAGLKLEILPPGHFWEFAVPAFNGSFKTKLRAKFQPDFGSHEGREVLYSNEFDGYINPGQLFRIPQFFKNNIAREYFFRKHRMF